MLNVHSRVVVYFKCKFQDVQNLRTAPAIYIWTLLENLAALLQVQCGMWSGEGVSIPLTLVPWQQSIWRTYMHLCNYRMCRPHKEYVSHIKVLGLSVLFPKCVNGNRVVNAPELS